MAERPDGGIVHCIPQLGQPLFVCTSINDGVNNDNCGQVFACELLESPYVEGEVLFQVRTDLFPQGFVVYPAQGVHVPPGKYPTPVFA